MGGQQNLGSPSGSFLGSSPEGAFPQPAQAAPGSSIYWQQIAPKLLSLFNRPYDTAGAATPPTTTTTTMPDISAMIRSLTAAGQQDPTEQAGTDQQEAWSPAFQKKQFRLLDQQLKRGETPDPAFLQSFLDSGSISWSPAMGWIGAMERSGAQSDRLVSAMDAFADYLDSKGLPNPQKVMPTIGYMGQIPPEGAQ
jgi:hypothetical protein